MPPARKAEFVQKLVISRVVGPEPCTMTTAGNFLVTLAGRYSVAASLTSPAGISTLCARIPSGIVTGPAKAIVGQLKSAAQIVAAILFLIEISPFIVRRRRQDRFSLLTTYVRRLDNSKVRMKIIAAAASKNSELA